MILQDANKYGTPKYRLVVRFSNKKVTTQVVYSTTKGDRVFSAADSSELSKWGLTTGQASYAASYAVGLLIARRVLKQLKLDTIYKGVATADGKDYDVSAEADSYRQTRRPFKAILDIGMINNTVGHRVFAVLKGACDGGLHIPHGTRKFFGSEKNEETKEWEFHPEACRDRILGVHIDEYMAALKSDKEAYTSQFGKWDVALKTAKAASVQELFKKVHAGIRADPERKKKARTTTPQTYTDARKTVIKTKKGNYTRARRLTHAEREKRVQTKLNILRKAK